LVRLGLNAAGAQPASVFTAFTVPAELRRAPCGWFAIAGEPPMLYAARAGELAAMGLL